MAMSATTSHQSRGMHSAGGFSKLNMQAKYVEDTSICNCFLPKAAQTYAVDMFLCCSNYRYHKINEKTCVRSNICLLSHSTHLWFPKEFPRQYSKLLKQFKESVRLQMQKSEAGKGKWNEASSLFFLKCKKHLRMSGHIMPFQLIQQSLEELGLHLPNTTMVILRCKHCRNVIFFICKKEDSAEPFSDWKLQQSYKIRRILDKAVRHCLRNMACKWQQSVNILCIKDIALIIPCSFPGPMKIEYSGVLENSIPLKSGLLVFQHTKNQEELLILGGLKVPLSEHCQIYLMQIELGYMAHSGSGEETGVRFLFPLEVCQEFPNVQFGRLLFSQA